MIDFCYRNGGECTRTPVKMAKDLESAEWNERVNQAHQMGQGYIASLHIACSDWDL